MNPALPTPAQCCTPCDGVDTVNVPGPQGLGGDDGSDGTNGVSAFTISTAAYTQPAVGATVTVSVGNSTWMAVGENIFIQTGGTYEVTAKPTSTSVTVENLGYTGNAAPAVIVATNQVVTPSGVKGDTGSSASASFLDGSATLDFPSVAATGGTQDLTIGVVGAAVNDPVSLGPPTTLNAGLVPYGFVSAVNVVTVRITNATAGALDPASALWKVRVHK